jgi:predicted GIY-YIG superfamily endonuclease
MFHVYLLRSIKCPQMTYVGFTTKDIRDRMDEHNRGLTRTTAPHIPWSLEVIVTFHDRKKAEAFERYLKNGSGYAFAKRHLWSNPRSAKLSAMHCFAAHSA